MADSSYTTLDYIIKQLYHSLSSYMAVSSYTTRAHGIIVKYFVHHEFMAISYLGKCFLLQLTSNIIRSNIIRLISLDLTS